MVPWRRGDGVHRSPGDACPATTPASPPGAAPQAKRPEPGGWISRWLGLLTCMALLMACQPAPETPPAPAEPARPGTSVSLPDARYEIVQPTLAQQDEQGRILWKLQAQSLRAESRDEQAQGTLLSVRGWLYRDGKPVLEFRAPYARANAETREVEAWGTVEATSRTNDARLKAGRILWKARADRIIAREGVFLKWGALELHERTLVVDTALERIWGSGE